MEINDERIQEWIDKCPEHDNEINIVMTMV